MNRKIRVIHVGNALGYKDTHGGFQGDIFDEEGVCPTLRATGGGGQPMFTY